MPEEIEPYVPFPVFVQDNPVENYSSRVYPIYETEDTLPGGGGGQEPTIFDLTVGDTWSFQPDIRDLTVGDATISSVPLTYLITVTPNPVDFGAVELGETSGAQIVTITNVGTGPVTITGIVITGDFAEETP
jgi:hypothetical protein